MMVHINIHMKRYYKFVPAVVLSKLNQQPRILFEKENRTIKEKTCYVCVEEKMEKVFILFRRRKYSLLFPNYYYYCKYFHTFLYFIEFIYLVRMFLFYECIFLCIFTFPCLILEQHHRHFRQQHETMYLYCFDHNIAVLCSVYDIFSFKNVDLT